MRTVLWLLSLVALAAGWWLTRKEVVDAVHAERERLQSMHNGPAARNG